MKKAHIIVNFNACMLNVSSSLSRKRAVLSNTIMASAKIPKLERKMSGNSTNGVPLNLVVPKKIPIKIKSNASGTRNLLLTQEQISPTNKITAIAVVIISASSIGIF